VPYTDPVTREQREGDVVGHFRVVTDVVTDEVGLTVQLAVECKAGRAHPWVGFFDHERLAFSQASVNTWFKVDQSQWPGRVAERLANTFAQLPSFDAGRAAVHVATALGDDSRNVALNAARQSLAFARARAARQVRYMDDPPGAVAATAVLPVVVTCAPPFSCHLDDDGGVVVESLDHFDVLIPDETGYLSRVYVRTEESFAQFALALAQLRPTLEALLPQD